MIKVTVITVCYNAVNSIGHTIKSVLDQTYRNIEFIIIDGKSTDGTFEAIKKNMNGIAYFVSEPDTGIYNAMNKGIAASNGDVLFFLNADDRFFDERVVEDVTMFFDKEPTLGLVYGNVMLENSRQLSSWRQMPILDRKMLARKTICHQSIFARKETLFKFNGFSEHYNVVSDYEWLIKLAHSNVKSCHIERDISIIGIDGRSRTTKWELERLMVMVAFYSNLEIFLWRIVPNQFSLHSRFFSSMLRKIKKLKK